MKTLELKPKECVPPRLPPRGEMERAYLASDAAYRGVFLVAVRTTGIFCRPDCPARKPLPKNVEFFQAADAALAAGYRACKRCRPLDDRDEPEWAAELVRAIDAEPAARITERELATRGLDPATVRRHFLRVHGMTFQAYARSRRLAGGLARMQAGGELDAAVFASGYESHSGFRDAVARIFGSTPRESARRNCIRLARIASPLGPLVAGATADGVCLLEFSEPARLEPQLAALRRHFASPAMPGTNEHLALLEQELAGYFAGTVRRFSVPLLWPGTGFQEQVWRELLAIPYGETRSYEAIAAAIGSPRAVRAVGTANGRNRLAILIPCHRVVNKSGALGGYGGGLRRKEFLLALERRNA